MSDQLADYAPLGACPAHSGQHADCPVRRTLREVCDGMQPTASLSRAWRRSDARGAGDGSSRLG